MILVVDDDAVTARVWTYLLNRLRHRVVVVASGREALRVLVTEPVEAIVCAMALPDVDGLTLIAQCRRVLHVADLPIIVCTGQADADTVRRALALHVADFLVKPVRVDRILPRVQRALLSVPPRWETRRETVRRLQVSTLEVTRLMTLAQREVIDALTLVTHHLAEADHGAGSARPEAAGAVTEPAADESRAAYAAMDAAVLRVRAAAATVGARRCTEVLGRFLPTAAAPHRLAALRDALVVEAAAFAAALPADVRGAGPRPPAATHATATPSGGAFWW